MLFNSLHFLVFFPTIFFLYYLFVPDRHRWLLLLVGSCYFYMVFIPKFILVLFFLIILDYFLGIQIAKSEGGRRKMLLTISIVANLGTLFLFKYFNFFSENLLYLAQAIHWNYSAIFLQIALPLGLSFHIFQSLSYVIEVYRGKQEPERHIGIYALYVMFFPQLVAGPIERPQHMLHQFHEPHRFDSLQVRHGLEIIAWGFFKKMVIADKIALLVDHVYSSLASASNVSVVIAAILFSYQLYCDFSGYSDIAVGSAMVFGYDLTQNFNRPYAARSIADFWRRWHISLSSWLRDYLYYPLIFISKRISKLRLYASLFLTFALIGLWHGANWTYVVFGSLHGLYMVIGSGTAHLRQKILEMTKLSKYKKMLKIWQTLVVFVLATASFVFFRANSLSQASEIIVKIYKAVISFEWLSGNVMRDIVSGSLGIGLKSFIVIIVAIVFLELIQYLQAKAGTAYIFDGRGRVMRWGWYYTLILSTICFGYLGAQTFIYFKF